ncbi:MAG TPA: hypothetical protein VN721_09760 [Flavipsychrobacter sp.]|nr:hypothetical protein [Flavipsychrobacter sp.]
MNDHNHKKPLLLTGLVGMKCPNCRKGNVFVNKSVLPLGKCLAMVDNCSVCGQKMKYESNNGGGINYALTMMLFFLNLLWYWPIFGLSYKDNSIFYFLIASIIVVIVLQPWLMRLSRMIYLYMFIHYGSKT